MPPYAVEALALLIGVSIGMHCHERWNIYGTSFDTANAMAASHWGFMKWDGQPAAGHFSPTIGFLPPNSGTTAGGVVIGTGRWA